MGTREKPQKKMRETFRSLPEGLEFRPNDPYLTRGRVPGIPDLKLAIYPFNTGHVMSSQRADDGLISLENLTVLSSGVLGVVSFLGLGSSGPSLRLKVLINEFVLTGIEASLALHLGHLHNHLIVWDLSCCADSPNDAVGCEAIMGVGVVEVEGVGVRILILSLHS